MEKKEIKKIYFIEAKSPRQHIYSLIKQPRLGIVILATILKKLGYESEACIEDIAEIDWHKAKNADLIGISSITSTAPQAFHLAQIFRSVRIPIVMGGSHSTFLPEESLRHADFVVRGEGEETIVELIEHLNAGKPLNDILGLSFKQNGKIVRNPDRPLIQDLDSVPIPNLKLIKGWQKIKAIPVATSRGCPFGCKFCSVIQMFGRKYRFNSVERIIQELKNVSREYPGKHVFFIDDNFTADKERTKELLKRILVEKIKIEWSAQVRADAARDAELVRLMKETGCFTIFVGFESVNPATLKLYNKKQKLEDIVKCINVFHRAGIHIHGMFVLGADTDDIGTVRATAKFAIESKIDSVQFLMLTPLPGTPVFEELLQGGRLLHRNWEYYDAHHAVFQPFFMSPEELHQETLTAMQKFYSRRRFWKKFLTGDFFYAMITHYGRRLLAEAIKNEEGYFTKIRKCAAKEQ